ncbi:hypothetical protein ACFFX0_07080 [Citricoccus parietis]|uniref:Uncharacterized protein n=1 Tax=Citricoccus parietis TaxID=592307 RepID=A0ABV5FWB8_9MICC
MLVLGSRVGQQRGQFLRVQIRGGHRDTEAGDAVAFSGHLTERHHCSGPGTRTSGTQGLQERQGELIGVSGHEHDVRQTRAGHRDQFGEALTAADHRHGSTQSLESGDVVEAGHDGGGHRDLAHVHSYCPASDGTTLMRAPLPLASRTCGSCSGPTRICTFIPPVEPNDPVASVISASSADGATSCGSLKP